MNINELKKKIEAQLKAIEELRKKMMVELQSDFHSTLKELFDAYPIVKAIHFTAYTPYWNDGEECTYRCHVDCCGFNGYDEDGEDIKEQIEDASGPVEGDNILTNSKKNIYVERPNPKYNPAAKSYDYETSRKTIWVKEPNPNYNPAHGQAVDAFREFLKVIPNDYWKEIVGNHCTVFIDRNSIRTKFYDHE